jgi:uncharacterized Zn-binding protein involved in type VI secretion
MIGTARFGDRTDGTCYNSAHDSPLHTGGTIVAGSGNVSVDSLAAARLGDLVQADCGHFGTIATGAGDSQINSLPSARLGDTTVGDYIATIITSSSSINT